MKVYQIVGGFCYWDATRVHPTIDSIVPGQYPPYMQFVEAPDYVQEGWGYDSMKQGDARFVEPPPPLVDPYHAYYNGMQEVIEG